MRGDLFANILSDLFAGEIMTSPFEQNHVRAADPNMDRPPLHVISAKLVPAKAGSGNPLRKGGACATMAGSIAPLEFVRTLYHSSFWYILYTVIMSVGVVGGVRKNGEWFELSASEVSAFKRRRFM